MATTTTWKFSRPSPVAKAYLIQSSMLNQNEVSMSHLYTLQTSREKGAPDLPSSAPNDVKFAQILVRDEAGRGAKNHSRRNEPGNIVHKLLLR